MTSPGGLDVSALIYSQGEARIFYFLVEQTVSFLDLSFTLREKYKKIVCTQHRIELKTFSSPLIGSDVAIGSLKLLPTGSTGRGEVRLASFQHSRRSQIVQSSSSKPPL